MKQGSILSAILWIFFLSSLLGWIPIVGSFTADFVSGRKARDVGNAIVAVFLPAIILGIILFGLTSSLRGIALIGAIAGMGSVIFFISRSWAITDRINSWRSNSYIDENICFSSCF